MLALVFRQYKNHCGLLDKDTTSIDPKLNEVMVLSSGQVLEVFNTNEEESSYEDENDIGI